MIVGTYINIAIYFIKKVEHCEQTDENQAYSLLMYASYFVLFAHFYYKVYFGKGKFAAPIRKRAEEELEVPKLMDEKMKKSE